MNASYSRPGLSTFLLILGVFAAIGGALGAFLTLADGTLPQAISIAIAAIMGAAMLLGLSQVIDYLGRSAFYAEQSSAALQRLAGTAPASGGTTSTSVPIRSAESQKLYRVGRGSDEIGKFTRQQISQQKAAGKLTDADYYYDETAGDWMTLDLLA